jgi:hypothetical protein
MSAAAIGIYVGLFVGFQIFVTCVREMKRARVAKKYGICPKEVRFHRGCDTWLLCLCYWPVVFCPIDIDTGKLKREQAAAAAAAAISRSESLLQATASAVLQIQSQLQLERTPPPPQSMLYNQPIAPHCVVQMTSIQQPELQPQSPLYVTLNPLARSSALLAFAQGAPGAAQLPGLGTDLADWLAINGIPGGYGPPEIVISALFKARITSVADLVYLNDDDIDQLDLSVVLQTKLKAAVASLRNQLRSRSNAPTPVPLVLPVPPPPPPSLSRVLSPAHPPTPTSLPTQSPPPATTAAAQMVPLGVAVSGLVARREAQPQAEARATHFWKARYQKVRESLHQTSTAITLTTQGSTPTTRHPTSQHATGYSPPATSTCVQPSAEPITAGPDAVSPSPTSPPAASAPSSASTSAAASMVVPALPGAFVEWATKLRRKVTS